MTTEDYAEQYRAQMYRGPDPALAARAAKESRVTNSHLNRVEIGIYNEQGVTLEQQNSQLIAFGDLPTAFETADPLGLHWRALRECIAGRDRLIWQQSDRLDYLKACAEETAHGLIIANETPGERILRERAETTESRLADLEARLADSQRGERYVPPPRPLPPMAFAAVGMGDGLTPGFVLPPSQGVAPVATAQRVGKSFQQDTRPALACQRLERLATDVSSPSDFVKACGR
jgi:hypothetical protein